nr:unnamed protein product [Naegleria fowleri]
MCILSAIFVLTHRSRFFVGNKSTTTEQPIRDVNNNNNNIQRQLHSLETSSSSIPQQEYQRPPLPLHQQIPQHDRHDHHPNERWNELSQEFHFNTMETPKPLIDVQIEECVRMEQAQQLYMAMNCSEPPALGERFLEMETAWHKFSPSLVNIFSPYKNHNRLLQIKTSLSSMKHAEKKKDQMSSWSTESFTSSSSSPSHSQVMNTPVLKESSSQNTEQLLSGTTQTLKETEFRSYFDQHRDTFRFMSYQSPLSEDLDDWKNAMNELNFVMNADQFDNVKMQHEHHLPIWLRVFQRTKPLDEVLQAVCQIHNINESILIVTIDGSEFYDVIQELTKVQCVKTRIYFHAFHSNLKTLLDSYVPHLFNIEMIFKKSIKLLTHAMYGLYLAFVKYQYPYVITLEDDIKPLPDFYNYHRSLYTLTLDDSPQNPYYTVSAYAHGSYHHCRYISGSLFSEKLFSKQEEEEYEKRVLRKQGPIIQCRMQDTDQLVLEEYHAIWGSGIPRRVFQRLWHVWIGATVLKQHSQYFLGVLLRDLRKPHERTITPCSNRITRLANMGENGEDDDNTRRYWTLSAQPCTNYQNEPKVKFWKYHERHYQVLNVE